MVFPKPEEKAVLTINGSDYSEWGSVSVKHEMKVHPWIHFRFTCSEGMPLAENFSKLQIVPGMDCTVTLAGKLAATGLVCSRQVFADSKRHHIEIQGASDTMELAGAAAVVKGMELTKVDYKTFAKTLIKPWPAMQFLEEGGSVPSTKFPRISIAHGSTVLDALERPLRSLGHVQLTTNVKGDLVAAVGPNGSSDTVYEGDLGNPSYIEAREIIYNVGMAKGLNFTGQRPGTNQDWGAKVSHVPYLGNMMSSFAGGYAPQVVPLEIPAWSQDLMKGRSGMEQGLQGTDQVTVFVTVNGWLRPSGGLWERNQTVQVISPMLVMKGSEGLVAKSVTFTQDNQTGTRTTLELCNSAALGGSIPQGS
jgi:prophage tail gpP-like protein